MKNGGKNKSVAFIILVSVNNPTEKTQDTLRKYKFHLNELINKHTQFLIHRLRQENFHHSNKSGKYLANQIKQNKEKTKIPVITDTAGKSTNSPEEINQLMPLNLCRTIKHQVLIGSLLSSTNTFGPSYHHSLSE